VALAVAPALPVAPALVLGAVVPSPAVDVAADATSGAVRLLELAALADVVGFGSSDAWMMMSAAVPTTTLTPTIASPARISTLDRVASGNETRESRELERGAGTASGEKS
jgi:hypothetical protein